MEYFSCLGLFDFLFYKTEDQFYKILMYYANYALIKRKKPHFKSKTEFKMRFCKY